MATPVARSLFNKGKASLRFIRTSLLCRSNTNTVKDQSLLAPSGIIGGQCHFQNPSRTDLNQQAMASIPHLLGGPSLVGGEDWRGLGRKYCLAAEDELEMRRCKEIPDGSEYGGFDSDDAEDLGDFDEADFDDDDGDDNDDDEDDDEDDEDFDVPRKRRK